MWLLASLRIARIDGTQPVGRADQSATFAEND
jgi:hypothetical protein